MQEPTVAVDGMTVLHQARQLSPGDPLMNGLVEMTCIADAARERVSHGLPHFLRTRAATEPWVESQLFRNTQGRRLLAVLPSTKHAHVSWGYSQRTVRTVVCPRHRRSIATRFFTAMPPTYFRQVYKTDYRICQQTQDTRAYDLHKMNHDQLYAMTTFRP